MTPEQIVQALQSGRLSVAQAEIEMENWLRINSTGGENEGGDFSVAAREFVAKNTPRPFEGQGELGGGASNIDPGLPPSIPGLNDPARTLTFSDVNSRQTAILFAAQQVKSGEWTNEVALEYLRLILGSDDSSFTTASGRGATTVGQADNDTILDLFDSLTAPGGSGGGNILSFDPEADILLGPSDPSFTVDVTSEQARSGTRGGREGIFNEFLANLPQFAQGTPGTRTALRTGFDPLSAQFLLNRVPRLDMEGEGTGVGSFTQFLQGSPQIQGRQAFLDQIGGLSDLFANQQEIGSVGATQRKILSGAGAGGNIIRSAFLSGINPAFRNVAGDVFGEGLLAAQGRFPEQSLFETFLRSGIGGFGGGFIP